VPEHGRKKVSIEILEAETVGSKINTIHQLHWELLEDLVVWELESFEVIVRRLSPTSLDRPFALSRIALWR
jgi:hypothetical protein